MEVCLGSNKSMAKHTITIEGKPISLYVDTNHETLTDYTYTDCISTNIVETVDCSGETTRVPNEDGSICDPYNLIIHAIVNDETGLVEYTPDKTCFVFEKDGWYRFTHLIIPTKLYFVSLGFDGHIEDLENFKQSLYERFGDCELPERIVVFDTEKYCFLLGEFFQYQIVNSENPENETYSLELHYDWKEITFDEVLCIANSDFTSTIKCYSDDMVNYSYLEEAYLNKVNELLKKYLEGICQSSCSDFAKSNQSDIQLRDYYWMALNAVKYANELGNYCKALTLLDCVSLCNSKDSDTYCFLLNNRNGCGCS